MLETKLVIRILDEKESLLGWAEVVGKARGDGTLWVENPTFVPVEKDGIPLYISTHWCDVNVEIRALIEHSRVVVGDMFQIPGNWTAIVCGPAAGGLPPVTVRNPIRIGIPVGVMGAKGN